MSMEVAEDRELTRAIDRCSRFASMIRQSNLQGRVAIPNGYDLAADIQTLLDALEAYRWPEKQQGDRP